MISMFRYWIIVIVFLVANIQLLAQDTEIISFNNNDLKLLFDYYHHNLPTTKVGNHIKQVVG